MASETFYKQTDDKKHLEKNSPKNKALIRVIEYGGKVYFDRNMPLIMEDHVSTDEWVELCNQLDSALVPANSFKRQRRIFFRIFIINMFFLSITVAVALILRHKSFDKELFGSDVSTVAEVFALSHCVLTCAIASVFIIYAIFWRQTSGQSMRDDLQRICDNFSKTIPLLNFSLHNNSLSEIGGRITSVSISVSSGKHKKKKKGKRRMYTRFLPQKTFKNILIPSFKGVKDIENGHSVASSKGVEDATL